MLASEDRGRSWTRSEFLPAASGARFETFPSMTIFRSIPIVLYYRQTPEGDKVPTNVIASTPGPPTRDIQLNSETSDWLKVRGDKDRAPIQRTFGDYITLTSDGKRLAAAWTDGRSGEARIYTRIFKMP